MSFKVTVKIEKGVEWYVATCIENHVASQGKTIDEAIANLKEAIELYYEDEENIEELNYYKNNNVFFTTLEVPLNAQISNS